MTDDIDTMTPEQLDEAVAREVMDYIRLDTGWHSDTGEGPFQFHASTDIFQAMEVVEKIDAYFDCRRTDFGSWSVAISYGSFGWGDTLPLAICHAALRWARSKA